MERNQLKIFAKNLLGKQEYSRFKTALKSFEKTECILSFCVELLEIVNAPEKTELLVEVRKMLPKSKQSEFSKVCRDLVNERWTMKENRRMEYEVEHKENNDVFSSPAKRARRAKSRSKLRGDALKTGISNQQASRECSTLQQQIISEVSYFSNCKRSFTLTTVPDRDENQNQPRCDPTARQELVDTRELQKDMKCKVVRMERESSTINFGFKIQGDLFTEQEIVVRQVDKNSIAERSGLRLGDRITKINGIECIRAMKSDIVAMIKSVNKLNLQVISNGNFKEAQNTTIHDEAVTIAISGQGYDTKQVTIYTDEDGWMGCSIRGGIDYDCEVHVISVEDGSPAESAGLRQGDIITEVNGVSLHGTTHVQAVEHILKASPPVTFTVKRNSSQCAGFHGSGGVMQNDINNLPHTPLRSRGRKPRRSLSQQMVGTVVPTPPLSGYWYDSSASVAPAGGAIGSPSALPLHALHLDGTPPPPYTVSLPQMHRVIQMGVDVMANGTGTVSNHGNPGPFLPAESEMIFQRNFSSTPRPEGSHTTHQRELGIRNGNFRDESISKESEVSSCNDNDSDSGAGLTENGHSAIQCDHADKGGVTSNSAYDIRDAFFDSEAFTENLHSTIQQGSTKPDDSGSNEDDINDYTNIDRKTLSTKDYYAVCQEDRDNEQVNETVNVNEDNRPCLLEAIRNFNQGLLKSTKNRNISFAPCKTRPSSGVYMNNCTTAYSDTEHVHECPSSVTSEDRAAQAYEDADLRAIINQALIKRRADVLNSSQESANDSCSSEWEL